MVSARDALRRLALATAVCAAASAARADPDTAGADPVGDRPRQRPELARVGWEDGPTYAIGWFDPVDDGSPEALTGFGFRGRLGGQLSVDGGHVGGTVLEDEWDAVLRRGRITTTGDFTLWRETDYKLEFGFQRNDFYLNELSLRRRVDRFADVLQFGYFDPPISLDALASSTSRPLMESPAPVTAFAPGGRVGIEAAGTRAAPDLTWVLNLSSVGQVQDDRSASNEALRAVGRLVWRPWYTPTGETPGLLHLGGSVSVGLSGRGDVQFRARPESYLASYVVDTGELEGDASGFVLEAAWQRGSFVLQGELFETFADVEGAGSITFHGSYVQLAWSLTGELRPYDREEAVFLRLVPRRPFEPRRGQWGALELAGRVSWLDLSDGSVRGGQLFDATVGLTWTMNAWVRLQAGYVYARVRDRPVSGGAHILQSRLELRF